MLISSFLYVAALAQLSRAHDSREWHWLAGW